MKKSLLFVLAAVTLSACPSYYYSSPPTNKGTAGTRTTPSSGGYRLAASHWSDVSKIRAEAYRLNSQVGEGKMTKVQAAQNLNRFRLKLVGSNQVDDDVYESYLRSAVDSQRGEITTAQSKNHIQSTLKGWQQRWPNMQNKPANPAFTNFLMELMEMQPLR
ncbi:MAG: prokaryotic membrane lipolipid attachment site family protein [Neisseria sp.]|nr:prokaryotic membrane lipolipid attachment site family protein [Neisseria sp.]